MPQRPSTVRLSALGSSPWIPLNYYTGAYAVGLGVVLSSNGNLTANVQHTFDDIYLETLIQYSRVTTTLTITKTNHGLSAGSWAKLEGSGGFDAEYAVTAITDQNNFTVTVADAGPTAGSARVKTARVFNHDTLVALVASADGNYIAPPKATRLNVSAFTAGYVDLNVIVAGK